MHTKNNYKGVERNKRNTGDAETSRNWQQQEATTTLGWHEQKE